ncbi:MAG: universal stress protein [Nitrospirae bacterium]|nr:universal stress protein [Nitrospirota bacterium]
MIKRILVGLGGTPYTSVAIQRAVELAERFEAEMTGVTVIDPGHLTKNDLAQEEMIPASVHRGILTRGRIEETISEFESACAARGIKHKVRQEERAAPYDLMISLARYHDLMIFGLRSIFEYKVSVVDLSIEEPKDTLARLISAGVRPIIAVSDTFRPIQKVMIAYSGSMASAKTMKRFVQLRLWPDVRLKIVTFQSSEEKARQLLYDASEYCRAHDFHVESESNPGSPKDFLLPMATLWQADMIVLGNSARNLLLKQVMGETALHIIRNADRPLFLCQ